MGIPPCIKKRVCSLQKKVGYFMVLSSIFTFYSNNENKDVIYISYLKLNVTILMELLVGMKFIFISCDGY